MARQDTIKSFWEVWVKDEANVQRVLDLIAGGTTLHKVTAQMKKVPYRELHAFLHTPEMLPRYEAARKAWADAKQDQAMEIVENVKPDRDHVAKAKLQVETIQNQAKAYHRERWGEKVAVEGGGRSAAVDAALLGTAAELLRLAKGKREEREVVGRVVAEVPAALPGKS